MKIKITLKAWLIKYWDGEKERVIEIPEGATCDEALKSQGIDYSEYVISGLFLSIIRGF